AARRAVQKTGGRRGGSGRRAVNAARPVAWQLRWRGENFYSGGEIWNPPFEDMKTVFVDVDTTKFSSWLKPQVGSGKSYFLITEIERVKKLRELLMGLAPDPSLQELDRPNTNSRMSNF